jgi:ATP-dependent DNA helicase DinG
LISFETQVFDVDHILGPEGLVASGMSDYEHRPGQVAMSQAIMRSFETSRHLLAEAGTGTGKSFAYLTCAIFKAVENNCRVLVSTHTINLQEQLINKDLPFLAKVLPWEFTANIAKGRSNYICLRRFKFAKAAGATLFDGENSEMQLLAKWLKTTNDGSLSSIPFVPSPKTWEAVQSEHGNCKGRKCPSFRDCFYMKARRALETSNIIVANHALMFSDLVLKKQNSIGIIPDYAYVIIDEAHNIEQVAEQHIGINLSSSRIAYTLNGLFNSAKNTGLLKITGHGELGPFVEECRKSSEIFFESAEQWISRQGENFNGKCPANFIEDTLSPALRTLRIKLNSQAEKLKEEDDSRFELGRYVDILKDYEDGVESFIKRSGEDDGFIYWLEYRAGRFARITLRSAPLEVGPHLEDFLYKPFPSIIATSATLSCGGEKGFGYLAGRIGLKDYDSIQLDSHFDYKSQVKVYIETGLPEPNSLEFTDAAADKTLHYIKITGGRAFVLFTSYRMLEQFADKLRGPLEDMGIQLLSQGSSVDRTTLLKEFVNDTQSVLFGTESFWQGVDVPGEALSNVIIVKLPFAVPSMPLIQGKIERIRQKGGNPFNEFQLPSAIIKFKQGFGRLIRKKTDRGIVAVLDSRIVTKYYGRLFLKAIPECTVEHIRS